MRTTKMRGTCVKCRTVYTIDITKTPPVTCPCGGHIGWRVPTDVTGDAEPEIRT